MILYTNRSFDKQFAKLSPKLRERFKERRNLFLDSPFHPLLNNHALSGERLGQWSINITGDWRALYEFFDEYSVIFVEINTHSNLYR